MKKKEDIKSTGFGSKIEDEGERLLNKDGSFNIEKTGIPFRTRFHLYHSLINMSVGKFILWIFAFFIIVNSLFALIYVVLGVENLGLINQSGHMQFLNAFFFSAQTITTVGYGAIAPHGIWPNIVASFEAFIGLLSFAMATGLLYGRFSRPRAKLLYSKNALVAPYQDSKGLMIRLANARSSQMIRVSARIMLSMVEEENNQPKRKFYNLTLEMDEINMLPASWTIVHPIDAESPLYMLTEEAFMKSDPEIILSVDGYDETYSQQVHSRTSYKSDEVVFNARFLKIVGRNSQRQATIALDRLSDFESVAID